MPRFNIILADPPWAFKVWSGKGTGRCAEQHYPVLDADSIKALPIATIAAPDCALFLWCSGPLLRQALETMVAWDFCFKTVAFVWTKPQIGCGYWTRAQYEFVLLGTRGRPRKISSAVRQHLAAPRTRHSAKPPEIHDRILALMGDLPRIELFARLPRPGWVTLGNEIDGKDIRDALKAL